MQFSLLETSVNTLTKSKTKQHQRYKSVNTNGFSRYTNIPTENIKFEKFIDLIFSSKMKHDEMKDEIKSYVKALETNYNDTIRELKASNDRLVRKIKKVQGERVNTVSEKNEIEALFVDCIEDVRKEVMKRRLKNEIIQKKKGLLSLSKLG